MILFYFSMAIWNLAPWIIIPLCANFNMLDFLTVDPRVFFMKIGGNVRELRCFSVDQQNYLHPAVPFYQMKIESGSWGSVPDL